jgi:hypothetical protein
MVDIVEKEFVGADPLVEPTPGEQQGAAGGGDVGVPGGGGQDQGAVGQLLFTPAPETF